MTERTDYQSDRAWNFNSVETEAILRPLCEQVEKLFELPPRRLCRYFAGFEDPCFADGIGHYYRGFHVSYSPEVQAELPVHLQDCFRPLYLLETADPEGPYEDTVAFDDLIYVRHSTCRDPMSCAVTYAHELQHFVQNYRLPELVKVNKVLRRILALENDIPAERDANIKSKRVAEIIFGAAKVREFSEKLIKTMKLDYMTGVADACKHKVKWEFFRDISPSYSCDVKVETLLLVEKHKGAFADSGLDVNQPGLLGD